MEMETSVEMNETVERLAAAAGMLEAAVSRLSAIQVQAADELESKVAAAEARLAELTARAGSAGFGRKTLQAKGTGSVEGLESVLDAALVSLSVEQRIAVKAGLMRGGLIG